MDHDVMKSVLSSMVDSFDQKRYQEVMDSYDYNEYKSVTSDILNDPQEYLETNPIIHKDIIETAFLDLNNQYPFYILNFDMIRHHIESMIRLEEGSPCCHDKSGTIMYEINTYLKTNTYPERDYHEKAFHLPKGFFRNENNVIELMDALNAFHYGASVKYLTLMINFKTHLNLKKMEG